MISVTDLAADYLSVLLSNDAIDGDPVVRIARSDGSWSARLDVVRSGDEVVERNGRPLVAYAEELEEALDETVLDVREDDQRPQLVLTVPKR